MGGHSERGNCDSCRSCGYCLILFHNDFTYTYSFKLYNQQTSQDISASLTHLDLDVTLEYFDMCEIRPFYEVPVVVVVAHSDGVIYLQISSFRDWYFADKSVLTSQATLLFKQTCFDSIDEVGMSHDVTGLWNMFLCIHLKPNMKHEAYCPFMFDWGRFCDPLIWSGC